MNAQDVDYDDLIGVVTHHIDSYSPQVARSVRSVEPYKQGSVSIFLVHLNPEGWILVSGDLRAEPVLGFNLSGDFVRTDNRINDPGYRWINTYAEQIATGDFDLQQALGNSMHEAVNLVASANTIAAIDQGKWLYELTVNGIGSADDYRRCLDYLQNLSIVDRVSVTAASRGIVHFSLDLNAMSLYLDETLASGHVLEFYAAQNSWSLRQ